MIRTGWIGVDFDGTLARYETGNIQELGEPITPMVERVKKWLEQGYEVRVVTARVSHDGTNDRYNFAMASKVLIKVWCREHIGRELMVVHCKDYDMIELWDDRVVQVRSNEGVPVEGQLSRVEDFRGPA